MTGLGSALVLALGGSGATAARLAVCVLLGQLSVGWCNDAHDAEHDVAADRQKKPVVRGMVDARTLRSAAVGALVSSVVLSVALLGPVAGGWHVAAVLAAWGYNLWLKDTPASPVPYAVAFAAIPVVVSTLVDPSAPVRASWVGVGALVGVAVHLANTAPDVESDRSVGRGGLACTLGAPTSRLLSVALLGGACALLLLIVDGGPGLLVAMTGLLVVAGVAAVAREGALLFPAVLVATGVGVVTVLLLARA